MLIYRYINLFSIEREGLAGAPEHCEMKNTIFIPEYCRAPQNNTAKPTQ